MKGAGAKIGMAALWRRVLSRRGNDVGPVDFSLPDDTEHLFTYDAEFRRRRGSVLVWYRGHW